jgi:hypothetical protein
MIYTTLAGMKVTLQDKNLILPSVNETQNSTVLCIAPIWDDNGTNTPPADEGVNPSYDVITIRRSDDFVLNGLGLFTTTNPLARLWKQANDAGASTVKVVRLHGSTLENRYLGILNCLSALSDYDAFDILTVGGVYSDDVLFTAIADAADKLVAKRNLLLLADNADEQITWTAKGAAVSVAKATLTEPTLVVYELADEFVQLSSLVLTTSADVAITSFTAHPADGRCDHPYVTGIDTDPATIKATYNYTADAAAVDAIDLASGLVRKVSRTVVAADIATTATLVTTTGTPPTSWSLDLSLIAGYDDSLAHSDLTITDSNGEMALAGVAYVYDESADTLVFLQTPLGWTISFGIKSFFDFGATVAAYLNNSYAKGQECVGVMATKPLAAPTLKNIKDFVNAKPTIQYSSLMSVVSGPRQVFQLNGIVYMDVWTGAYAGMVATLPSYADPLGKAIPGVIKQEYQLSDTQSLAMTNKNYVVSRLQGGYITCSDAKTTAGNESDFANLTTIRIVNEAVALVRETGRPYIGKPNTIAIRAGLETAIKSGLEGMVKSGAITAYKFMVGATQAEQIQGSLTILLELVPVFSIREIRVSVAVRPSL